MSVFVVDGHIRHMHPISSEFVHLKDDWGQPPDECRVENQLLSLKSHRKAISGGKNPSLTLPDLIIIPK